MAIEVSADGLSIVTTKSNGKCMATLPDVCKIPGPNGPISVPFANMVESKNGKMTSIRVKLNGGNVHCLGSYCEPSTGDEGGILKGVVSGTTKGKATYLKWSPTVKVEGRPVCRKSDLMIMNTINTMGMAGMNQADVGEVGFDETEEETKPFKMKLSLIGNEDQDDEFRLTVRGQMVARGKISSEGLISADIPASSKTATLLVGKEPSTQQSYTILLEDFPQGEKGVQARLNNLGYAAGRVDNRIGSKTKRAIEQFQNDNSVPVTGKADGTVENKLKSLET